VLRVGHRIHDLPGKVKIGGKMLKMMQLRGPLAHIQTALATIDTEY
jgi:hypothetical protein